MYSVVVRKQCKKMLFSPGNDQFLPPPTLPREMKHFSSGAKGKGSPSVELVESAFSPVCCKLSVRLVHSWILGAWHMVGAQSVFPQCINV